MSFNTETTFFTKDFLNSIIVLELSLSEAVFDFALIYPGMPSIILIIKTL